MVTVDTGPWYTRLHWQIFLAMGAGTLAGVVGGAPLADQVGWLGTLFVRLLKMIIVPLVFTSIISGVASVGAGRDLGRLFGKTLGYYVVTSALAILTGLLMVNLIRPGVGADIAGAGADRSARSRDAGLHRRAAPRHGSRQRRRRRSEAGHAGGDPLLHPVRRSPSRDFPQRPRETMTGFFEAAFQAMMRLTGAIVRLAPIGVFGLIVQVVGTSGLDSFRALGFYMLTIASGLTLHLFVTLPLFLLLIGRIKPRVHFRNLLEPLTMAFSTASSAATLPVTLRAVEQKVGVSNRVSSFVLPMGATVNMDGTALYECAGVIFIAQVLGVDLSFSQQAVVVLTALLASIGAAAVPSAGPRRHLPGARVGEPARAPKSTSSWAPCWPSTGPLDMFRTAVNVFSDSVGAAIIARSEGEDRVDVE